MELLHYRNDDCVVLRPEPGIGVWSFRAMCGNANELGFKCLPYQLSMVRDMPTMVVTGNGESGFDSGEGA